MSYWFHIGNFSENMTSNVAQMWRAAGCDLRELKEKQGREAVRPLCHAINTMMADPDRFKELEPANGWGTYQDCIDFLRHCHDACYEDPDGIIHVSY